jgi:hypothetical protein
MAGNERAALTAYRDHPDRWDDLAFLGHYAPDGRADGWVDLHAVTRYRVLIGLQYDLQPGDQALVEYLFDQEVLYHRAVPLAGLFPSLLLASYLLASFHAPRNVGRFWAAMCSNFDAHCGLDQLYLFSAGVEPTLEVASSGAVPGVPPGAVKGLLDSLGTKERPHFTDAEVASWWAKKRAEFPDTPERETLRTRIRRALDLEERDEAARLVRQWEAEEEHTLQMLRRLRHYRERLEDWAGAAAATRELLALSDREANGAYGRAVEALRLAAYERRAGRPAVAWGTLRNAMAAYPRDDQHAPDVIACAIKEATADFDALPAEDPACHEALDWVYAQRSAGFGRATQ